MFPEQYWTEYLWNSSSSCGIQLSIFLPSISHALPCWDLTPLGVDGTNIVIPLLSHALLHWMWLSSSHTADYFQGHDWKPVSSHSEFYCLSWGQECYTEFLKGFFFSDSRSNLYSSKKNWKNTRKHQEAKKNHPYSQSDMMTAINIWLCNLICPFSFKNGFILCILVF